MREIVTLPDVELAEIMKILIAKFQKGEGRIYGCNQLLDMIEEIAIEKHFIKCPHCKR